MSVTISNATLMTTVRAAIGLGTTVMVRREPQGGGYSLSTGVGTHTELGVWVRLPGATVVEGAQRQHSETTATPPCSQLRLLCQLLSLANLSLVSSSRS